MGWDNHVEFRETLCNDCGIEEVWEFWTEVAVARYGGELGRKLGHDVENNNRCPHCGSTNGSPIDDDEFST